MIDNPSKRNDNKLEIMQLHITIFVLFVYSRFSILFTGILCTTVDLLPKFKYSISVSVSVLMLFLFFSLNNNRMMYLALNAKVFSNRFFINILFYFYELKITHATFFT